VSHLTYLEATIVGAFQGVTELFPVSSLGHRILVPALVGGQWAQDLDVSAPESPYLAFIVGLHVATAAALVVFFWRDWVRIIGGLISSIRHRRVRTSAERLAWLIILASIPVGIAGLLLDHLFRTTLGRPIPTAGFLIANGLVLYLLERLGKRAQRPAAGQHALADQPTEVLPAVRGTHAPNPAARPALARTPHRGPGRVDEAATEVLPAVGRTPEEASDERLARLPVGRAVLIGSAQILALLPGISRSGITMVTGLRRGLSHEDAARFSFLLATPVILAAGALKLPDLTGPMGAGIGGQILAGSVASFVAAYVAVRFLTKYFHTKTLTPFAWYCVLAGAGSLAWLTLA
jgi:undecaprenyl-diphosphatase